MQKLPHHRSKTLLTLASPSLLLPAPPAPIVMDYHGLSWIITDYHGLSWIITDYHGLSWIIMVYHGLSRIIMDYHGLSPIIMDYHGLSWIITDYHGLSSQRHLKGLSWIIITYYHRLSPLARIIITMTSIFILHRLSWIIITAPPARIFSTLKHFFKLVVSHKTRHGLSIFIIRKKGPPYLELDVHVYARGTLAWTW